VQTPDVTVDWLFGGGPYVLWLRVEGLGPGDRMDVQPPPGSGDPFYDISGTGTVDWYSADLGWAYPAMDFNNGVFHDVSLGWTDATLPEVSYIDAHPDAYTDATPDFPPGELVMARNGREYLVFTRWDLHAGSGNARVSVMWVPTSEIDLPPPEPPPPDPVEPPPAPPVAPPVGPREPTGPHTTDWIRTYLLEDIVRILPPPGKVLATAQPTDVVSTPSDDSTVWYALGLTSNENVAMQQDVDPTGFDEPQPISHNADSTVTALRVRPSPNERLVAILPGGDLAITYVADDNSSTPFPMPKESIYPNWDSFQNFGPNDAAWIDDEVLVMGGFFTYDPHPSDDHYLECARRTGWASAMTWERMPVSAQPFDTVQALAYHQGTGLLAVGDSEANLYLYRMVNGTLSMVDSPSQSPIFFGASRVEDLAWNPAGDRLAVGVRGPNDESAGLYVYSVVNDGLNVVQQNFPEMGFRSDSCSFSHDGEFLAATAYYLIDGGGYPGTYPRVWRTSDWVEVFLDDAGENWLATSLVTAWSPTENRLLAVGEEQIAT
jgi:hypothetical protein